VKLDRNAVHWDLVGWLIDHQPPNRNLEDWRNWRKQNYISDSWILTDAILKGWVVVFEEKIL
jgi:hypothetical protein